jgi:hypothetical protein
MKIVYIAHPIGGNVENNIEKIKSIIRFINLTEPDIVPFAHYIVDCLCLDDNNRIERERGIKNDIALFKAGFINELWLYGDKISTGMGAEIALAIKLGIPVISKSKGTDSFKYTK